MPDYTYLACDWKTLAVLDELPLSSPSPFTDPLNSGGSFSASLSLDPTRYQALLDATAPYRTVLFIQRDGLLVWGGWCWSREWSSSSHQWQLSWGQYDTYFDQREIKTDLSFPAPGTDQLAVARTLIDYAQGVSNGNVNVTHGNPAATSGVLFQRNYLKSEQNMVGAMLRDLAGLKGGFDYHFDISMIGVTPTIQFVTSYPYRGMAPAASPLVFEYPGNIDSYIWPEGGGFATAVHEQGGTPPITGAASIESIAINAAAETAGYPRIDQTYNRSDVTVQATLDNIAAEDLRLMSTINRVPQITMDPSAEPQFGTYVTGDYAQIIITDERFPASMTTAVRIVDRQMQPSNSGNSEKLVLLLENAGIAS
jgi:hypothetical protein